MRGPAVRFARYWQGAESHSAFQALERVFDDRRVGLRPRARAAAPERPSAPADGPSPDRTRRRPARDPAPPQAPRV